MVSHKTREVKNCWGLEEGSVSKDCKDDFFGKLRFEEGSKNWLN